MPLLPLNSVGGYSTGITGTAVIDANGNITGVGATFSSLVRFNAGISSAGATLSANTIIPSGSTLTVNGNFVANGNVNLGDATTDSITVAGLLSANSGISAAGSTFYGAANFFANPPTNPISLDAANGKITVGGFGRSLSLSFPQPGPAQTPTCSLPTVETVLAGLSAAQTFTNTNTFNTLTNFPGGISAAGATFSSLVRFNAGISAAGATFGGNVVLQNQEFIRNNTDGRIDFMPAPSGSTHYGMYLDFTSWGFGPRFGTIRSSDGALNTTGILWDAQLNLANNVRFNFGSNGQNGVVLSDTGNDTIQLFTNVTSGTNSGAVAIVDVAGINAANRAPGVTHTNPNLYVYRAGSARANDFMRFEHDGDFGRIVSGGTSGINIQPGSGFLGISGGISAAGGTFTGNVSFNTNIQFADGTTQSTAYKDNLQGPIIRDNLGDIVINPHGMVSSTVANDMNLGPTGTNMLLLNSFYFPRGGTLTRIGTIQGSAVSGHTGQIMFSVHDVGLTNGLPNRLIYASSFINITTSGFARYEATPNVFVPAGSYWIGMIFNRSTPYTGGGSTYSWSCLVSKANPWDSYSASVGRLFNNGLMGHLRYNLGSGVTLASTLSGFTFTSALSSATANPGVSTGNSDMVANSRCPWVGVSIQP